MFFASLWLIDYGMTQGTTRYYKKITLGPLEENCFILWTKSSRKGVIMDPGAEPERILEVVQEKRLKIERIINTHCHVDHVGAVGKIQQKLGVPFYIQRRDEFFLEDLEEKAIFFGIEDVVRPEVSGYLEGDELLEVAGLEIKVIHTPGHTPGGLCFLVQDHLFSGDTLFAGSIGRTDFEGGSIEELMESLSRRILPLGDHVRVLPGHGPDSTIGWERRTNLFVP